MSKPVLGLMLGGVLGIFDGLTAWFTPAVRDQLAGIVVGSTIKGLIAGIAIGYFAKKFNSLPLGIVFGLAVGFLLAFLVAFLQKDHYFEIILPGSILGLVVGFATQKYGRPSAQTANASR
jgi:ABC-type uncharacterized transport system permease subunit